MIKFRLKIFKMLIVNLIKNPAFSKMLKINYKNKSKNNLKRIQKTRKVKQN